MWNTRPEGWGQATLVLLHAVLLFQCAPLLAGVTAQQNGSLSNGVSLPAAQQQPQPAAVAEPVDNQAQAAALIRELNAALEGARARIGQLESSLHSLKAENAGLKSELEQKTTAIKALTESVAVSQTEMELFRRKYEEQRLRMQALGAQTSGEETDLSRKLAEALRALQESESVCQQLRALLKRVVEIAEALVPLSTEGPEGAKVRSQILEELARVKGFADTGAEPRGLAVPEGRLDDARVARVNPELQLVVLNIGRVHGVRLGMPFVAVRGDRVVAQLQVVDVRERICGATIIEQQQKLEIGDRVRVQVSKP